MAIAAISLDVFQSFDVAGNFALQVTLYLETLYELTDGVLLINGKVFWLNTGFDIGSLQYIKSPRPANAVNSRQGYFHPLIFR